jgi:EpsI family protein
MKIRIVILSLIMIVAAAAISYASRPKIMPIRQSLEGLPMWLADWEGRRSPEMDQKKLDVLGVDDYISRVYYRSNSIPVSLYIGYYESQRSGDAIHSPMNCMPGSGWDPVRNERISIPVNDGKTIEVNRITIRKGTVSQVVLYWYQSHGRVVASEYMGKIYTVLDAMRTNRTDAALVRIISQVSENAQLKATAEEAAEKEVIEFTQTLFPLLADFLPE